MSLDRAARERLVRALAVSMIEHAEELSSLDQAIGDGDHGLNMKRGFDAVLATLPGLAEKSLPEMLKAIGMTLVMKVGGASGPLVGTFFMELGKALPEQPARVDLVAVAPASAPRPIWKRTGFWVGIGAGAVAIIVVGGVVGWAVTRNSGPCGGVSSCADLR